MSWFHSSTAPVDARNHASPAEVVACFHDQRNVLGRLAFLITGDHATADQAVVQACEITLQGNSPFRDWLLEWAKMRPLPVRYHTERRRFASVKPRTRIDDAHMSSTYRRAMMKNAPASLDLILGAVTQKLLTELDPLCRAVLVLRLAIRSSIQDCALRLNVSRAAVLGANCHAMTWLHDGHVKPGEDESHRCACPLETLQSDSCALTSPWSGGTIGLEDRRIS